MEAKGVAASQRGAGDGASEERNTKIFFEFLLQLNTIGRFIIKHCVDFVLHFGKMIEKADNVRIEGFSVMSGGIVYCHSIQRDALQGKTEDGCFMAPNELFMSLGNCTGAVISQLIGV